MFYDDKNRSIINTFTLNPLVPKLKIKKNYYNISFTLKKHDYDFIEYFNSTYYCRRAAISCKQIYTHGQQNQKHFEYCGSNCIDCLAIKGIWSF